MSNFCEDSENVSLSAQLRVADIRQILAYQVSAAAITNYHKLSGLK